MKIRKGVDCYPLPDDWDREVSVPLRLVSSPEFQSIQNRNPGMTGSPIIGCVIKGFDDGALNRLYVWPSPVADEDISIMYMPNCIGKTI